MPTPGEKRAFRHEHATLKVAAKVSRRETFEGRAKLVAPVTVLTKTVIACATCPTPELTDPEDYARDPSAWNGHPVTFDHPMGSGHFLSAHDRRAVGFVIGDLRNAHRKADEAGQPLGRLGGEVWIDIATAKLRGASEVIDRIEAGEEIEISPGFYADTRPEEGEYDGRKYGAVEYNYEPDHLAILPRGAKGACSWAQGCGIRASTEDFLKIAAGEMPSDSMAAGIDQSELQDICEKKKTTWSSGKEITEGQRLAACAAWNKGKNAQLRVACGCDEKLHAAANKADYAYTPTDNPSDWKLPIHDAQHASMAAAALSSGGFRGQKVDIPSSAVAAVRAKVRAAWKRFNPNKSADEMPESLKAAGGTMKEFIDRIIVARKLEGEKAEPVRAALEKLDEPSLKVLCECAEAGAAEMKALVEDTEKRIKVAVETALAKKDEEIKAASTPSLEMKWLTSRLVKERGRFVDAIKAATKAYSDEDLSSMPFDLLEKTVEAVGALKDADGGDFTGRGGPRSTTSDTSDPIDPTKFNEKVRALREGKGKAA